MKKQALLFFALLSVCAFGQGVRYDVPPILNSRAVLVPNANISLCPGTATITNSTCSPASTQAFTDITLTTPCATGSPVVLPQTNVCSGVADALGNAGFWLAPGAYIYCINGPSITGKCYNLTVPVGGTASGAAITSNIDNMLYVDGGATGGTTFPTCQAAVTAAGANNRIIVIPPTYAGQPDCPASPANVDYWNFDSTRLYLNGFNWFQTSGGGTRSFFHPMGQWSTIPASGANVTGYFTSTLTNATVGTGVGMDGSSSEANVTGTLSGTLPALQGAENNMTVSSTGGTITNATGLVGYYNSQIGSTTAVTTVMGVRGLGCNNVAGAAPTNCFGLYAERQNAGSQYNKSIGIRGIGLLLYSSSDGLAGLDMEDNTGTGGGVNASHRFLYLDSSNNTNIQAVNATQGMRFNDSTGALRASFTSANWQFANNVLPTLSANFTLGSSTATWFALHLTGGGTTDAGLIGNAASINTLAALPSLVSSTLVGVVPPTLQKAETGADANVLTFTPPAAAGTYRVCISMAVSAQNTATLGWTATWTDSNGSAQAPTNLALSQTGVAAPALTFTAATNGNYFACQPIDVNNSATAIVVKTTFAGTSIAYKVSATIERSQ